MSFWSLLAVNLSRVAGGLRRGPDGVEVRGTCG